MGCSFPRSGPAVGHVFARGGVRTGYLSLERTEKKDSKDENRGKQIATVNHRTQQLVSEGKLEEALKFYYDYLLPHQPDLDEKWRNGGGQPRRELLSKMRCGLKTAELFVLCPAVLEIKSVDDMDPFRKIW